MKFISLILMLGIVSTGKSSFGEHGQIRKAEQSRPQAETIGFGGIPAPQGGVKPLAERDSGLVPANTNGNPSFSFYSKAQNGGKTSSRCQATLVRAANGFCTAATAAHCLYEDVIDSKRKGFDKDVLKKDSCAPEIKTRGALWGELEVTLPDFGTVKAIGIVNQEYYSKTRSEDSAVFTFSCPNGPGKVPVLTIAQQALKSDEKVSYGKGMGKKPGLYQGRVFREPGLIAVKYRAVGEALESVMQPPEATIQSGDSGGGVFRIEEGGQLELAGVLSAGDDERGRRPLGNYATNKSLDFVRCLLGGQDVPNNNKTLGAPKSMSEISVEHR